MRSLFNKHFPATVILLLFLIGGSYYLFAAFMDVYPSYVHAWTQTDRLALAMNFQENGFDFFHPATYNLLTKDGITQVDFPIHDYLIALLSSVLDWDLVSCFRWYNLLYSLLGLFFFYRTLLLFQLSDQRAVFGTLFLSTIPFYLYYQNGFLASAPSFANFLLALYFFKKAELNHKFKHYLLAACFFTLAALSRTPFVLFLLAFLGHQVYKVFQHKQGNFKDILPASIGFFLVLVYYFYNQYLAATYGSMFLSELLALNSLESIQTLLSNLYSRWLGDLLSPFHFISLLILLVFVFLNKKNVAKSPNGDWQAFTGLSVLGVLSFFIAMGRQFGEHDYYFLDSFLPLLALLLIYLLKKAHIPKVWYTPFATWCLISSFYFYSYGKQVLVDRYTPAWNDRIEYAYSVYEASKEDLANWGVSPKDTLLVLDAVSTNMPFTVWKNRGYTLLNSGKEYVQEALKKDFTYVIILDSNLVSDTWKDYPDLVKQLDLKAHNGQLGLYSKSKDTTAINFFRQLHYYGKANFDELIQLDSASMAWMKTKQTELGTTYYAPADYEFFLSTKLGGENIIENRPIQIMVNADYKPLNDSCKIQLTAKHANYYGAQYLQSQLTEINQWQNQFYRFKIKAGQVKKGEEIALYFWNPERSELLIDNLSIIIYQ